MNHSKRKEYNFLEGESGGIPINKPSQILQSVSGAQALIAGDLVWQFHGHLEIRWHKSMVLFLNQTSLRKNYQGR